MARSALTSSRESGVLPASQVTHVDLCDTGLTLPSHDWTMSFEVGEHLPTWCLPYYVSLLDRSNTKGIVLSWSDAPKGTCHVNPRTNKLAAGFAALGYIVDRESTNCLYTNHSVLMRKGLVLRRNATR